MLNNIDNIKKTIGKYFILTFRKLYCTENNNICQFAKNKVMDFKMRFTILIFMCILISGCSLFSTKEFNITNPNATEVARHNLYMIKTSLIGTKNYLLVNENGKSSLKDMFLYINALRYPLEIDRILMNLLIKYNRDIIEQISS